MPVNLFTPNMPASGDSLGFTRPLVLGNFGNYKENIEVNHMGVNSADFGKHKYLTMPQQSYPAPLTDPVSFPTSATEGGMYFAAIQNRSVAFIQRESYANQATGVELGMVQYPLGNVTANFFTTPTAIIDVTTITDTPHPNFWGICNYKQVGGVGYFGASYVFYYGGTLSAFPFSLMITNPPTVTQPLQLVGNGTSLQAFATSTVGGIITVAFTLTAFYIPTVP